MLLRDEFVQQEFRDVLLTSALAPKPVPGRVRVTNLRLLWEAASLNVQVPFLALRQLKTGPLALSFQTRCGFSAVLQPHANPAAQLSAALLSAATEAQQQPVFGVTSIDQQCNDGLFGDVPAGPGVSGGAVPVRRDNGKERERGHEKVEKGGEKGGEGDREKGEKAEKTEKPEKTRGRDAGPGFGARLRYLQERLADLGQVEYDEELGLCFERLDGVSREELL